MEPIRIRVNKLKILLKKLNQKDLNEFSSVTKVISYRVKSKENINSVTGARVDLYSQLKIKIKTC